MILNDMTGFPDHGNVLLDLLFVFLSWLEAEISTFQDSLLNSGSHFEYISEEPFLWRDFNTSAILNIFSPSLAVWSTRYLFCFRAPYLCRDFNASWTIAPSASTDDRWYVNIDLIWIRMTLMLFNQVPNATFSTLYLYIRKHCRKRWNCSLWAIIHFSTVFSRVVCNKVVK